ncbi:mandelate racemase/muconate lactonizing enzyme family protein [Pigmentiphaga litoralis]|uniref:D-galactarolactone cycloisomerase n=1 Tax=Pigmentiphaga litoralis TaxID=516702 RepID=A0A7Y9LK23_9BURK|nr:mandelate racemase/muconate lactonizing enzyme family protein [Pigmentiphaga litoralis]NYE25325.1 D-galactarolactone cycloisomerase [Pigmentiphaga litoralis]NYE81062.1 D-galactarolactone cycloisomerase [Pigmentiphaga litoralis]
MKITDVITHQLLVNVDEPFTSSRGWFYKTKGALVVEIVTDEGVIGWGDCYGPAAVNKAIVDTVLRASLIGRDPFDVEVIWEELYNKVKDYGLTGMTISAISGVDIALWDIIGKAVGKPIHKLIGGAFRTELQAYATGLYFKDMDRLNEQAVEEARGYVDQGFKAIKMKIGLGSLTKDIDRVAAVRDAIGNDIQLMVDANHCFTVPQAINLGRELEKLGVHWFEEPISPEDLDGYVEVSRKLDMAIAGGENEFTKFSFRRILEKRAMDIVQPDVCAAGGITECKKIAALAQAQAIQCVPHAWGTAIGLAATMHFLASLPNTPPCLVPQPPMLEYEQTFNPFRDELSSTALTHVGGIVHVPTGPGLGIEINRAVLDKYRVA